MATEEPDALPVPSGNYDLSADLPEPIKEALETTKEVQMKTSLKPPVTTTESDSNEEEEKSPMYKSVQQIDPMRLWRPKFGLTPHEKTEYEKNHEEPKLMLPKPSFSDKRVAIEKKLRLKAELAMPKRTVYKTRKMGKSFKPKRSLTKF